MHVEILHHQNYVSPLPRLPRHISSCSPCSPSEQASSSATCYSRTRSATQCHQSLPPLPTESAHFTQHHNITKPNKYCIVSCGTNMSLMMNTRKCCETISSIPCRLQDQRSCPRTLQMLSQVRAPTFHSLWAL
jgi:hypothetical protein